MSRCFQKAREGGISRSLGLASFSAFFDMERAMKTFDDRSTSWKGPISSYQEPSLHTVGESSACVSITTVCKHNDDIDIPLLMIVRD